MYVVLNLPMSSTGVLSRGCAWNVDFYVIWHVPEQTLWKLAGNVCWILYKYIIPEKKRSFQRPAMISNESKGDKTKLQECEKTMWIQRS